MYVHTHVYTHVYTHMYSLTKLLIMSLRDILCEEIGWDGLAFLKHSMGTFCSNTESWSLGNLEQVWNFYDP